MGDFDDLAFFPQYNGGLSEKYLSINPKLENASVFIRLKSLKLNKCSENDGEFSLTSEAGQLSFILDRSYFVFFKFIWRNNFKARACKNRAKAI